MAVVETIGLAGALLLGFATSLAGLALSRQTGTGALNHLRSAFSGAPQGQDAMFDGSIRAIAAFLLILPGFISDLAGLALAAPSLRQMLVRRFGDADAGPAGRLFAPELRRRHHPARRLRTTFSQRSAFFSTFAVSSLSISIPIWALGPLWHLKQ